MTGSVTITPDLRFERRAARLGALRLMPAVAFYANWMVPVLAVLCVTGLAWLGRHGSDLPVRVIAGCLLVAGFIWSVLRQLAQERLRAAREATRAAREPATLRVLPEGLELTDRHQHTRMGWVAFDDVLAAGTGIVLRLGASVIPVPAQSFPDAGAMAVFADDLRARIAAAKGPAP